MLSLTDLKKYYVRLYEELRNYLWDFRTVEAIAELEIAVYRRFPDSSEIKAKFNRLYSLISNTCAEDTYLATAATNFKNTINSSDTYYSRITKPREVS